TLRRCPAKVDIGFGDRFNSATSDAESPHGERVALGRKIRRRVRPGHADLRWAAPIWSISASLLCVHSFRCPLLGVKRTWLCALHMSAFDPKRTCSVALHTSASDP